MVPQMHAAQPPGRVEMRVGPFEQLAALAAPARRESAGRPRQAQLRRPRSGSET